MSDLKYPLIVSSYEMFEYCKDRYPKRTIDANPFVENDAFYYWSRAGQQRMVRNKKEIWVCGNKFPEIVRIR